MKRFLIFGFILFLGLVWLADPGFSAPRDYSYRSAATAGMLKSEYDRLSDNPAYVGAKIDYLEYQNSITKEKTNVFTVADGLNDDGRFVLGGIGDPGLGMIGGIGGLIELGIRTNPYTCYYNPSPGNTELDFSYQEGSAEGSDVYYSDNDGNDEFDTREVLTANEERYNEDSHLNAKVAVGGIKLGGLTLGASFERNTDAIDGSTTGETVRKGGYSYIEENIINDIPIYEESRSFNENTTISPVNYLLTIGAIVPMGGFIEVLEAMLMVNYLQYEADTSNTDRYVEEDPGVVRETWSGNWAKYFWESDTMLISDNEKRDGLEYGAVVQTREKLLGFDATTLISWAGGGLTPNKERTTKFKDHYSVDLLGDPLFAYSENETGTYTYSGDGIEKNEIALGIFLRKNFTKDLAGGVGFAYVLGMSENKYTRKTSYRYREEYDDGDGIVEDDDDYTSTETLSYTDNFTDTEVAHIFYVPIGFEYQATPNLCWRIGVEHVTSMSTSVSKWERTNVRELYEDEDNAGIPGNETDFDSWATDTTDGNIGDFEYDTGKRSGKERTVSNNQSNDYYFGIGYSIDNCLQLDVLLAGSGNSFEMDAGSVSMSATYVVE